MKPLPGLAFIAIVGNAFAASAATPSFPDEKIGLPSLSLQNSIANGNSPLEPRHVLPRTLSQPRTFLDRATLTVSPKPAEKSGPRMRVIAPDSTVDYKLRIVVPSADLDPKMIVGGGGEESSPNR
jgi:hypothetical protein